VTPHPTERTDRDVHEVGERSGPRAAARRPRTGVRPGALTVALAGIVGLLACADPCDRTTSVVVYPIDGAGEWAAVDRVEYRGVTMADFEVCESAEVGAAWACGTNDAGPVEVRLFVGSRIVIADVFVEGSTCSIEGVDLEVIVDGP